MDYYTYLWLREDGTPYYVGKGCGKRAFERSGHTCLPPKDKNRILLQDFPDETSAFAAEVFLIAHYGRLDLGTGCLRNMTDGGEGLAGHLHSLETKMALSEKRRFRPVLPTTRDKLRIAMQGRTFSTESLLRMRAAQRSRKHVGHPHTVETKASLSQKMQGNKNGKSLGKAHLQYQQALRSQELLQGDY